MEKIPTYGSISFEPVAEMVLSLVDGSLGKLDFMPVKIQHVNESTKWNKEKSEK